MLTIDKIKSIVSEVCEKYGVKQAYLFGSYAKNTANENSDIDLIIDKGNVKTYKQFFHLCEELEEKLGTEVDLITEKGTSPRFFNVIKDERILLYGG